MPVIKSCGIIRAGVERENGKRTETFFHGQGVGLGRTKNAGGVVSIKRYERYRSSDIRHQTSDIR